MTRESQKIALLGENFVNWGGGVDFLRFCLQGLSLHSREKGLRLFLLLPDPELVGMMDKVRRFLSPYKRMMKDFISLRKPHFYLSQQFSRNELVDAFKFIESEVELIFYRKKDGPGPAIKKSAAEVVIPCITPLGSSCTVPLVGYIFDFQHKYYPEFFSSSTLKFRDELFVRTLRESKAVIVNASAVESDIHRFCPDVGCRVFSLPFAASPIREWFTPSLFNLVEKYCLPDQYFIISNQFWIHKDHETAFRALDLFSRRTGRDNVHIVCTGKTEDYQHHDFFQKLCAKVNKLGLENRVHFLGHIPKKDQIDIMKGAIAVLQPTLFEGGPGGGAIYDAVSLGVPAILSDISVNCEIREERNLFYFRTGDSEDLADKMETLLATNLKRPSSSELLVAGERRMAAFGEKLLEAIEYVRGTENIR